MHRGRTIKVPLEVTPDELSRAEEERKRELSVLIPLRLSIPANTACLCDDFPALSTPQCRPGL